MHYPSRATRILIIATLAALSVVAIGSRSGGVTTAFACAPAQATTDVAPSAGFASDAAIVSSFNNARATDGEGCATALVLPGGFDAMDPQHQMLTLFNLERSDRGLPALQLDTTLMSHISLNHAKEMAQYNYTEHNSPVNQPGGDSSPFARLNANPVINNAQQSEAENIAWGYSTPAEATYGYMYHDSASGWGHRNNILGYNGTTYGGFDWLGIGYLDKPGSHWQFYYVDDFIQDGSDSIKYVPPASPDNAPPTLNNPTYNGTTGSVTNVQDTGAPTGAAGVTGVVFYVDSITDNNGTYNTVPATQGPTGTWTAAINVPGGSTLHAVAVDGSGNYTDCTAATCSPTAAPIAFFHVMRGKTNNGRAQFTFAWRVIVRSGVIGFSVKSNGQVLNHRLISSHAAAGYVWKATAPVHARFSLVVIYRDGRRVLVQRS